MDSPLSYILEHFLKTSLKDYIKGESLILDSFSLFGTSLSLKNIELQPQKKKISGIDIELLSGELYDLSLEGSVFTKKVNIGISNASICIYIPSLDSILFSYKKNNPFTKNDPSKKFSFQTNQINSLYSIISQLSMLKLSISKLTIHLFVNIESTLVHIELFVGEIKMLNAKNEENPKEPMETKSTLHVDFNDIDIYVDICKINIRDDIYELINQGGNNRMNNESFIQQATFTIDIIAHKYRFERDIANKATRTGKEDYSIYSKFENFNKNNEINLNLKHLTLNIIDELITNGLIFYKKIENKKQKNYSLFKSGKKHLNNAIKKLSISKKPIGFKFKVPESEKANTYLTIIKYLTYISLVMKQKKYINFDLNFYTCEKLVNDYKKYIIKEDHLILDFLLEQNIKEFMSSPPISGGNTLFLNMDIFSDLRSPTKNNTLKAFMLFLLNKFIICKKCIKDYQSYDDFYYINFTTEEFIIKLKRREDEIINLQSETEREREKETNGNSPKGDKKEINNIYILEGAMKTIRDKLLKEDLEENSEEQQYINSDILLQLNFTKSSIKFYTNLKEYYLFKMKLISFNIKDITYRPQMLESYLIKENMMVPLLKVEYESELELFYIDKKIRKLCLNIPNITLILDSFCIYFTLLYFLNIKYLYTIDEVNQIEKINDDCNDPIEEPPMQNNNNQQEQTGTPLPIEQLDLTINHIVVNITHTHLSKSKNEESIGLQICKLIMKSTTEELVIKLDELLLGSILNFEFSEFLSYKKSLKFQTNILNIFEINQTTKFSEIKEKKIYIPFTDIIIEINKKDIDNIYKCSTEFTKAMKLISKFSPLKNHSVKKRENIKEALPLDSPEFFGIFFYVKIDKIIFHLNLKEQKDAVFKHIIAIMNKLNAFIIQQDGFSYLITFDSIQCFHKHKQKSQLNILKMLSLKNPIKSLIKDDKDTKIKPDEISSLIERIKTSFLDDSLYNGMNRYDCYFLYNEKHNSIFSDLAKIDIEFDHILLKSLVQFVNFEKNENIREFFTCYNEAYNEVLKLHIEIFPEFEMGNDNNNNNIPNKASKSDFTVKMAFEGVEIDCLDKRRKFVTITFNKLTLHIENGSIILDTEIKSIIDNRAISFKKREILTKKRKEESLKFKFIFESKNITLSFENARLVFLMRIVMDLVEYFYKIILVDIIFKTNHQELYYPANLEGAHHLKDRALRAKERIEKNKKLVIKRSNLLRRNNISILKKTGISFLIKDKSNNGFPNFAKIKSLRTQGANIQKGKTNDPAHLLNLGKDNNSPLSITITVKNSEVGVCMNSLKDEELLVYIGEMEFKKSLTINKNTLIDSIFKNDYTIKIPKKDKTFDLNEVDFYVSLKDVRIKKVIEISMGKPKEIKIGSFSKYQENIPINLNDNNLKEVEDISILILFQTERFDPVLSNMKIECYIPYMKVTLYTDIYEELLRIIFENLAEARLIFSETTLKNKEYYSNEKIDDIDFEILKKFFTNMEIAILNRKCEINLYNYPSKCSNHKNEKESKGIPQLHLQYDEDNCDFGKNFPGLELKKFGIMTGENLYLLLRFFCNGDKNIYTTLSNLKVELNKKMTAFKNYSSNDLISIKKKREEEYECLEVDLTSGKNKPMKYDINIRNMDINYYLLPLMALYRFFAKFFFYYQNKNIKVIYHDTDFPLISPAKKEIEVKLINMNIYLLEFLDEVQTQLSHKVKISLDFEVLMQTVGNTCTGPFESFNKYTANIKGGFFNSLTQEIMKDQQNNIYKDDENNESEGSSQFLDSFKIVITAFSKCDDRWKEEDRYNFMFIRYNDIKNDEHEHEHEYSSIDSHFSEVPLPMRINVKKDQPNEYLDYIRRFKFKEEEEIGLNTELFQENEFNRPLGNNNNMSLKEDEDEKENQQDEETKTFENENNDIIHLRFNIDQIQRITKIYQDINTNYTNNAKLILPSLTINTKFNLISYIKSIGVFISEIDIHLCDSQFNTQLFQLSLSKVMFFSSNRPDSNYLNQGLHNLNQKFKKDNTNQQSNNDNIMLNKIPDIQYNSEMIVKFLLRIYYHNSNQTKTGASYRTSIAMPSENFLSQKRFTDHGVNNAFNIRQKDFWEPFIEPLPAKYTEFSNENHIVKKLEILSLKPIYNGNRISRQRKFHSLNINLNERLMENINSLYKDYNKTKEQEKNKENQSNLNKKQGLTVVNLTEYPMEIDKNDNFEEDSSRQILGLSNDDKISFTYKKCKKINDKEEIRVKFHASEFANDNPLLQSINTIKESKIINDYKEDRLSKKNYTAYNIERPCKFFYIQRTNKLDLKSKEEREELKKNFDNKASILLNGEYFLVCEVEFNPEGNMKYVTFRSNEGIKNELDFPVCIKFVLKEKNDRSDLSIILNPGKYFYIPPFYLNNIKEIQFKPSMKEWNHIKFGRDSYPYNDTSFRQSNLKQDEPLYVLRCKIKELRTNEEQASKLKIDHIIFCIARKNQSIESEFLDTKIREKIDFIQSYANYLNEQGGQKNVDIDVSNIISDVTYVLTPVMKFYNNLPKEISIKKIEEENDKSNTEISFGDNFKEYFDVEWYIKNFKKEVLAPKGEVIETECKQQLYELLSHCDYDKYKLNSIRMKNIKYKLDIKIQPGEYIGIYEPFILSEKKQKSFNYEIKVESADSSSNSKKENQLEFSLRPFYYNAIIKSYNKKDEGEIRMITFPKIIKQNSQTVHCKSKNFFVNAIETNENYALSSYFYCPFLFLNCSDLNLEIKFKDYKKKLCCRSSSKSTTINISTSKERPQFEVNESTEVERIIMFNPSQDNRFIFELGNVTSPGNKEEDENTKEINKNDMNKDNEKKNKSCLNSLTVSSSNNSHWKKVKILDILKYGGKIVDLTLKKSNSSQHSKMRSSIEKKDERVEENRGNQEPVSDMDKQLAFSLQMKLLKNSTLIFITAAIYICNQTSKDIFVYHLPCWESGPIKWSVLHAMTISKFHYLNNYYPYVQLSFEDKHVDKNKANLSGLINFTLDEIMNKEFFVSIGDPSKEPLLSIKVYEEKGFKFIHITQRENVKEYPYVIINKLNMPISFKQKENIDDFNNEINKIYDKLDKKISRKITSHLLKEFSFPKESSSALGSLYYFNRRDTSGIQNNTAVNNLDNANEKKIYYTWEEPLLYDREKNTNILEIKLFGAKFEIDPQEIQKDVIFTDKVKNLDAKSYLDNIIDSSVLKGKIRIIDKKCEYIYELYRHALVLKSIEDGKDLIIFEFHDPNLICERKYNGNFKMKDTMKEFEMFCVSLDETNDLVEKMNVYFKKAKDFANQLVIKKYAKNKCIFVEITKMQNFKEEIPQSIITNIFLSIENIGVSFMMKHKEFMYIWLKSIRVLIKKKEEKENTLYKKIILKVKDYQIDHYCKRKRQYYPIVLSPLSDKSYDKSYANYNNILLMIDNLQMKEDLYQVGVIYLNITPLDLRLENKFLENLLLFNNEVRLCFDNHKFKKMKKLTDYVEEIDNLKFIESNKIITTESRIHVKQLCLEGMKMCFSIKFDKIDLFLETSSFHFLKPLIEELGLRILNVDSAMFSFPNYSRIMVYQSTNDFTQTILTFLFQAFISELIKALVGINSLSMQIVDNVGGSLISNIKDQLSDIKKYRERKGIKELYKTGYQSVSALVGSLFILTYKMMSTLGRIFTTLTLDENYRKKRLYAMNKTVKGLGHGIKLSFDLIVLAFYFMIAQFYYIPKKYSQLFHWTLAFLLASVIIIIGLFCKPVCGLFDALTKIMETIGVSINDIMQERVKTYARFPRTIKENKLREYNSTDALGNFARNCIFKENDKVEAGEISVVVPGVYKNKKVFVLLTLERLMVVEYKGEFCFKEIVLVHLSSFDVFVYEDNGDKEQKKDNAIWFKRNIGGREIGISMKKRGSFSLYRSEFIINLSRLDENKYVANSFDILINKIINNKIQVNKSIDG